MVTLRVSLAASSPSFIGMELNDFQLAFTMRSAASRASAEFTPVERLARPKLTEMHAH